MFPPAREMNESDEDDQSGGSVDLLAETPPSKIGRGRPKRSRENDGSDGSTAESPVFSPATSTLNQLSQQSEGIDLHYDISMLEQDKRSIHGTEPQRGDLQARFSSVQHSPNKKLKAHPKMKDSGPSEQVLAAPRPPDCAVDGTDIAIPRKEPLDKAEGGSLGGHIPAEVKMDVMEEDGIQQDDGKEMSAEESTQSDNNFDLSQIQRTTTYELEGMKYDNYQDYVNAKRQRNQNVLIRSGLLDISSSMKNKAPKSTTSSATKQPPQAGTRRSSRTKPAQAKDKEASLVTAGTTSKKQNESSKRNAAPRLQPNHSRQNEGNTACTHSTTMPRQTTGSGQRDERHVVEVRPFDVILGSGSVALQNKGNQRYLSIIHEHADDFGQPTANKDEIARSALKSIQWGGGRFLRLIESTGSTEQQFSLELDVNTMLKKIKKALHDRVAISKQKGRSANDVSSAELANRPSPPVEDINLESRAPQPHAADAVENQARDPSSSEKTSRTAVASYSADDVLVGRVGSKANNKFKAIIQAKFADYVKASGNEAKRIIIQQVMNTIKLRGGKFLEKHDGGGYHETDQDTNFQKVQRSFRNLKQLMDSGESQRHIQDLSESQAAEDEALLEIAPARPKRRQKPMVAKTKGACQSLPNREQEENDGADKIRSVGPDDVVFCATSRRTRASQNEGNRKYLKLLQTIGRGSSLEAGEKSKMIMNTVKGRHGQFLKKNGTCYVLARDTEVLQRIKQTLINFEQEVLTSENQRTEETPQEPQAHPSKGTQSMEEGKETPNEDLPIPVVKETSTAQGTLRGIIEQYEIHTVSVAFEGPLGITMAKYKSSPDCLMRCFRKEDIGSVGFRWSRVDVVGPDSQCIPIGIRKGDWVVHFKKDDQGRPLLLPVEYKDFKKLATEGKRPIVFSIARKQEKYTSDEPENNARASHHIDTVRHTSHSTSEVSKGKTASHSQKLSVTKPLSLSTDSLNHATSACAPFCIKCNHPHRKGAIHHPWCKKNAHFNHSGADEVVARLQHGRKTGCARCCAEFQKGRVFEDMRHGKACAKRTNLLQQKKCNEKLGQKAGEPRVSQEEARMGSSINSKASTEPKQPAVPSAIPKTAKTANNPSPKTSAAETDCYRLPPDEEVREGDSLGTIGEGDDLATEWVRSGNYWGHEEVMDCDIVVFAPFRGIGHQELAFQSSPRFELHPFATSVRYSTTHHAPCEGFQALVLKRDALCTRPWGFKVYRHEFGGACLVESVDPLGPARSATLMGSRDSCGLKTHDMLMQVNGKAIGGMKVACLALELDLAGSEVVLLVSRYKFPDEIDAREREKETECIRRIDFAMTDERLLEWTQCEEKGHSSSESKPNPASLRLGSQACEKKVTEKTIALCQARQEPITSTISATGGVTDEMKTSCLSVASNEEERLGGSSPLASQGDSYNSDPDDGNCWMGCVCGTTHRTKPVFWIQCNDCFSWYNVNEVCIGFSEKDATDMGPWVCGCTGFDNGSHVATSMGTESLALNKSLQEKGQIKETARIGAADLESEARICNDEQSFLENSETVVGNSTLHLHDEDSLQPIPNGTVVAIQEHAWAGVNNPEGIAKITGSRIDEEDGLLYDICYIIGKTKKFGVEARYVSVHEF